nr:unnamed protein product [Callosobruchus chinensis]
MQFVYSSSVKWASPKRSFSADVILP